jgi:SAM-dependent methyltransferase
MQIDDDFINVLGEVLWHSATLDSSIEATSRDHMTRILANVQTRSSRTTFLEVAAYAHVTGYMLAAERGWKVTLTDISADTLMLGQRLASSMGISQDDDVRRVAVDFHELPFFDEEFDVVYISSALHHTLRWKDVLSELLRVTKKDGVLMLQNEPCEREFCFYRFPTNRPDSFRRSESELDRLGILRTVAEPYPGSRPESLFGMIENQRMPLDDITSMLEEHGVIESLEIDSTSCISDFDKDILAMPRDSHILAPMIVNGLTDRVDLVSRSLDAVDAQIGISLPNQSDIERLSVGSADKIASLPDTLSPEYPAELAKIFGGAITAVVRRTSGSGSQLSRGELRYFGGERNGVVVAFPPRLDRMLSDTTDLLPDIQRDAPELIGRHFPDPDWVLDSSHGDLRYLVLRSPAGRILLGQTSAGPTAALVRVYGAPTQGPFRVGLRIDDSELCGVNVFQAESFLLRAVLPGEIPASGFSVNVTAISGEAMELLPPVTIAAARIVSVQPFT